MELLPKSGLIDVQAEFDSRGIEIDEVGIDQISYPLGVLQADGSTQQTVAEAECVVSLAAHIRGTHMSRFVEVLEEFHEQVDARIALDIVHELRARLDAQAAKINLTFPLFVRREAPVSGEAARMRFDCRLTALSSSSERRVTVGVTVPITSLCPCSKEISDYGAHSQRGRVAVDAELVDIAVLHHAELLGLVDTAASAPIYPLLKRPDERHVTMQAYDNPAFVEDVARDVAVALNADSRIARYAVSVANEESIHDHRAIARITGGRGG